MQKEKVMERGTGDGKRSCVFKYDHIAYLTILGVSLVAFLLHLGHRCDPR